MNILDLIILLPIAYVAYRGFVNGFFREVFGILGIIIAVYLTFHYMAAVASIITPYVENDDHAVIITGIVMFIGIIVVVQVIGFMFERFFEAAKLGIINKLAGMIFGALKSALFISTILLLLAGIGIPSDETTSKSASYPYVITVAPATFDLIAELLPGTKDFIDTIEETIQENNSIRDLPIFEKLDLIDS